MADFLTRLEQRAVVCDAAVQAFRDISAKYPHRFATNDDEDANTVQQSMNDTWNEGASNFSKVCHTRRRHLSTEACASHVGESS